MGYPDGYYYGQGRIICDTSTFSVGDTIRVRSMTDTSKVWNQQVATVGTALVFTVPPYDYYKICMVQDIGGVATEVGGVYKTVDYGQTLFINVLDKTTLGGVQGILNAHQHNSLMAVGDEVNVKINGVDVTFQDAGHDLYENNEIIFVAKEEIQLSAFNGALNSYEYSKSTLRSVVQSIFANINETDKAYLKDTTRYGLTVNSYYDQYTDKLWIPSQLEVYGGYPFNIQPTVPQHQFPIFVTQANRIKTYNGVANAYWTCEHGISPSYSNGAIVIPTTGGTPSLITETDTTMGVLPCFRLTADS